MQQRLISFEGIDGSGKSTVMAEVAHRLRANGARVETTREPGGTDFAEQLRELVLATDGIDSTIETLLLFAARRHHVEQRIRPWLTEGAWVLVDRFTDSTLAYQASAGNTPWAWVMALAADTHGDLWPGHTFWLDVPVHIANARIKNRADGNRFDHQDNAFKQKLVAGYAACLQAFPYRFKRMDATRAPHAICDAIMQAINTEQP